MTLTFAASEAFIAIAPGNYRFHVHVYEINTPTNGWRADVAFIIDP